jgi:hypothetical protein
MESGRIQITKPASFLQIFNISPIALIRRKRIHDYTHLIPDMDYVFELVGQGDTGHMTGSGKGIAPGDYLLLCQAGEAVEYQVEEISYYSNPSSMWTALLTRVSSVKNKR